MLHPVEESVQITGAKATFRTLSTRQAEVEVELATPTFRADREGDTANALQRILAADIALLQKKFRDLSLKFVDVLSTQGSSAIVHGTVGADIDRPWEVSATHVVLKGVTVQARMSATFKSDDIAELSAAASLLDALHQAEEGVTRRSYEVICRKALATEN